MVVVVVRSCICSCLSVYLSVYLQAWKRRYSARLAQWTWQRQKRNNAARLPQFWKLTTSRAKQYCETSFKMESWVQSWPPCTNAFCDFPFHLSNVPHMPRKKWCHVTGSAAPVTQNHLSKPEDPMLQNATPLRKSAPGPPNISDEHVFCTAPATRHACLQILFICPTPAIVFGNATKPSRFAVF